MHARKALVFATTATGLVALLSVAPGGVGQVARAAAPACNTTWTGSAGDSKWNTAGNWSTGKVPGPSSDVCMSKFAWVTATGTQSVHSLRVDGSMTLIFSSAKVTIAGALTNSATVEVNSSSLSAARIDNLTFPAFSGSIQSSGTSTITSSAFSNAGNLSVVGGALTLSHRPRNFGGGTLTGGDWAVLSGALIVPGDVSTLDAGLSLAGQSAAVHDGSGHNALGGLASVGKSGQLTVTDQASLALAGPLVSNGTVNVGTGYAGGGSLSIGGSYTQAAGAFTELGDTASTLSAPAIAIHGGSTLFGNAGTLNGDVTNGGGVQAGGTLNVTGNYVQTSSAVLTVGVSSTLAVAHNASVAGALNIANFLAPQPGTRCRAVAAGSVTGTFVSHSVGFQVIPGTTFVDVVAAPQIVVEQASVPPGGTATVDGGDFQYDTAVQIFLDSTKSAALATVTPKLSGAFQVAVVIPTGTGAGQHRLIAVAADGRTAATTVQVS